MADAAKAQKLAAARKKLKEFQAHKKYVPKNEDNMDILSKSQTGTSSENPTPVDSMTSSTHSIVYETPVTVQDNISINESTVGNASCYSTTENTYNDNNTSNNANFFNTSLFQAKENNHLLSNYFDTVGQEVNTKSLDAFSQNFAVIETAQSNISNTVENKTEFQLFQKPTQDVGYADPFELSENKVDTFVPSNEEKQLPKPTFNASDLELTENNINTNDINSIQSVNERKSESALEYDLPLESQENQKNIFSNTESLRQLSSQLNSLIETEIAQNVSGSSELELRNQELAELFKKEQLKTEQLALQLREYKTRISQLETEAQQMKNDYDSKLSREIGPLQEQLQYHIQTVGILVAEKTELTMARNQSQTTAKQKTTECEELQGRLKASRHRVAELEKEINYLKSNKENFDKHEQEHNREFERLKLEYDLQKEQYQDLSEELSELKEKLNSKINECMSVQQELQEKNSQLSLTQLKVQQLVSGENIETESQLEILHQQKIALEQQVTELTQSVKVASLERDQASQQYQQYVQQLNAQIQNLAENLESKTNENDALSKREQSLVKHIGELEKHLQQLQNERQTLPPVKQDNNSIDIKKLEEKIQNLQEENSKLVFQYQEEAEKQNQYKLKMEERENYISELEMKLEHLKDQPDASKLLAAMESDKVAASRAVEQNKKLKDQLEELHEGFIKMSNNKLELTEKLQSEQHISKELKEQVTECKSVIEHLHSVIGTKDKELTETVNNSTELEKQILQQNQLIDRLRHYEVHGNTTGFLQQELQEAKIKVEQLTLENQILLAKLSENSIENSNAIEQESITTEMENMNADELDNQMKLENNDQFTTLLKQKIIQLEQSNSELQKTIDSIGENENISNEDGQPNAQYLNKEKAMAQLEERFKKTIIEVADLTEEKQRLEHLVLQLQSETETIGEYVTLYQCQRAMLKEKTLEKDEQLKRLAEDREEMKIKLEELNNLVQKLIVEKGLISQELLHHTLLKNSNDICDVHKQENLITNSVNENKSNIINSSNTENNNENCETAGKIISLLSEIKTSNLVQPSDNIQNFHPCPWCSGQLITV